MSLNRNKDSLHELIHGPTYVHVTKRDDVYHYVCNQCSSFRDSAVLVSTFICKYCDNVNDKIFLVRISKPSKVL